MSSSFDGASAKEVNRELTQALVSVGQHLGFTVVSEYPVPGGRLDVVWTWVPSTRLPGLEHGIPVVGFEIESSWRTRKHVKGDLLNLQDAGVALGVIVLAGASDKDEPLRTFAKKLVDRPGANVLIWTADDVGVYTSAVLSAEAGQASDPLFGGTVPTPADRERPGLLTSRLSKASHVGKYAALHRWLSSSESASISMTFAEIEDILGLPLPDSCRSHTAHWHSNEGSAVARAIVDAGWKASQVNLADQRLILERAT